MYTDVHQEIRQKYNTLTKAQKKLADLVLSEPEVIIYKSITELADLCDIGEATISRFCKKLSLKGYQDFKVALARQLDAEVDVEQGKKQNSLDERIHRLLGYNVRTLEEMKDMLHSDDISCVVEWMIQANRICFFGIGFSYCAAFSGASHFLRITPKVCVYNDTHTQHVAASLMSEKDLAIVLSHSGATKDTVEIAHSAKKGGAKVVCITSFPKSPITSFIDMTLLYSSNQQLYDTHSFAAEIAQLYILDILYMEYRRRMDREAKRNMEITDNSVLDKMY